MATNEKKFSTVQLNWKEVYFMNCPMVCVEIGKDFMLEQCYIKKDFDVNEWAALEFLEKAAKELLEERWQKATAAKLPEATSLRLG